ncbi:MAG: 16S rRNA (cytidine(1402)-2'-O)-methyltransferase [Clostridia bacterium]|nr:16S rRNA (cytidine(1402)-2'-O)-methyltransferase [Clostridia bacterium]
MSQLYIVGTPIGNLSDVTYRAVEVLRSADVIACEDTRHTLALLNHLGIKKPLVSYYKQKEKEGSVYLADCVESGKDVALVSDAGMPCISDPGSVVVKEFLKRGLDYTVIPGPSAVVTAAALCGVEGPFTFLGFLPEKKKDKEELIARHKDTGATLLVYAAPHDVNRVADDLYAALGDRPCYFVKEMTKVFERVTEGMLSSLRDPEPKGEYVIVVAPGEESHEATDEEIADFLKKQIDSGVDKKTAINLASESYKVGRNRVYKLSLSL